MGIREILQGDRIYFDTNIFIYAFEEYPEYISLLKALFEAVDQGIYYVCTSELTLAEILVKPLIDNKLDLVAIYQEAIQTTPFLVVIPVTREILISAARIRAKLGPQIRLPDAIHIASARLSRCDSFLTNDKRLKAAQDPKVVLLDNLISRGSLGTGE